MAATPRSFQEIILRLQAYWAGQGCALLQPYDMEVGAGTFHPATTLRALGPAPWAAAYVQPSRRPTDGRYGDDYRGSQPVDIAALEDLLLRMGTLAVTVPEIAELDLNPVIATPGGVAVVDGRCRIEAVLSPSVLPMRRMRSSDRA